ncbi:hypothetical protein GCM10010275_36460 [Streptomyces litmocidini]|nr:hypothetical protein GCM10010275_36460 [Streptomyces litmocidini]
MYGYGTRRAQDLLTAAPGDPWERTVTDCLTVLCHDAAGLPPDDRHASPAETCISGPFGPSGMPVPGNRLVTSDPGGLHERPAERRHDSRALLLDTALPGARPSRLERAVVATAPDAVHGATRDPDMSFGTAVPLGPRGAHRLHRPDFRRTVRPLPGAGHPGRRHRAASGRSRRGGLRTKHTRR